MSQTQKKMSKNDRKTFIARAVCLTVAVVMIVTTLVAAVLSQVY